jgi:thioesterase domain-containing protein
VNLRVLADRARQLAVLPLAGLVRFPGMRQYDVFYNQGRVLTMAYRPEPWPGRALVWLADEHPAAPGAVEPGLEEDPRPVNGPWATLLRGPAVVRTVAGNHDSVLREPLVSQLAADIRAELTTPEPTRRR